MIKSLIRCTRGDIVSRRGEVFKLCSIYVSGSTVEVHVAVLAETDAWVTERYARTYAIDQQVKLLGHEEVP